jgi:hypothetical protein
VELEAPYRDLQLRARHRRNLVDKAAFLACQIRDHLHLAMPGYAGLFSFITAAKQSSTMLEASTNVPVASKSPSDSLDWHWHAWPVINPCAILASKSQIQSWTNSDAFIRSMELLWMFCWLTWKPLLNNYLTTHVTTKRKSSRMSWNCKNVAVEALNQ